MKVTNFYAVVIARNVNSTYSSTTSQLRSRCVDLHGFRATGRVPCSFVVFAWQPTSTNYIFTCQICWSPKMIAEHALQVWQTRKIALSQIRRKTIHGSVGDFCHVFVWLQRRMTRTRTPYRDDLRFTRENVFFISILISRMLFEVLDSCKYVSWEHVCRCGSYRQECQRIHHVREPLRGDR